MPGNSATVSIAIEVDDKGSVKIRQLGELAKKAGDEGARGFDAMGKSATGAERGVNTMATSLKAMGAVAGAIAASAVVGQLVQIGRSAIQAASDMEETQGKFDVVFQGMTAQAEAWAGELRASFNMSSLEAKRFLGDIQNMLVPAGLMREEAGKMSFELTKLAADLGSFNNMPTEQVFRDIMSALQGSTETMDKYGINVRSTLVEQEALNMGLAATAKELTQADRLTATYSLIMKQAGDAIGDTARTSESFANQQKQLNANLEEVRITIGQALLPEVNKITTDMNAWFKENEAVLKQDLATWAGTAAGAINILATAAHAGAVAIGTIDAALGKLGISYSSMADKWNAYSDSFQVVWEQATGVRDTKTGSFIDQQAVKIDGLQTKLAGLQQQAAATGESFSTGFEVGLGDSTAASSALTAEITETQAALDAARSASSLFQDGIKAVGVNVNDLSSFTDDLSVSTDGATTSTTKLGQAATDTAKALDTKSASSKAAAAAAKAEREAIAQVAVAMRNYANAAEPGTKATEQWAKGATDAAEAMADLNEHYATAGLSEYDALMVELNREFAEGQSAIRAYDTAMAEANAKVNTASREYEAAEAKLAEYRRQLEATSLSGEELQAKLGAAAGAVEKKRAALDAARSAARELEAANGGVIATEEDLRKRVFETNESLEQQRQRYIDTAREGSSFFAGVAAGMLEMQDSMMTLGEVGYEVFNILRDGWRDSFFAVMSGDLDDLGDIWDSTLQAMLRAFTDFLADLVMAWAAAGIAEMFGFQIPGLGGGMGSIGSAIGASLGSGTGAAGSWLGAAGYQPGAATGWTSYAGPALATAGGAYALYDAASKASKGEMNAGTAIEAAGGAYLAYTGGSALLGKLGTTAAPIIQDMVVPASADIMVAASDLTLLGPQTGGIGNAIAGGGTGAGLSTGAMVGGGAIMGIGALIAMGMGNKAQQEFYSPRYGNVPFRDYGHDDRQDMIRAGRSGYNWVSEAQPGSSSGSGDAAVTQTMADLERAFKQFESNTRIVLDVLAAAGDGVASLGQQLEDGTLSTAAFVDAIAGYDVSIQETATLTGLASEAARGNGNAMDALRAALQSMGLGADQAEIAALALVAASNNQATSLYAASDAAGEAASAVQSMAGKIQELSSTPLNIRVKVNVDVPYGGGDDYMAPRHAEGGIFIGPTLIPSINGRRHLVGEAGAEAIMPLHDGPGTLKKMDAKLDALLSGGRPVQHVINLDGRQIASATLPYVDAHVAGKASRGALTKRTVF